MENKVYKLKQEYPGSPKEGTVVVEKENGYEGLGITFPHKKFVEDYPDNWELQVNKPKFRIVEIISPCGKIKKGKEVIYGFAYNAYPDYKINSIERLSDGEIFKIGDVIDGLFNEVTIKEFKINKNDLVIFSDCLALIYLKGDITYLKKIKNKLFTTEDGVNIFEGDTYWCVNTAPHLWSLFEQTSRERTKLNKTVIAFSTEEKAEEYIKMNKPEFSKIQVRKLLGKLHFDEGMKNYFINELEKQ